MAEKEKNTTDFGADPSNFVNRELSWLEFNYRVLSEARDKSLPLFERLKFLSITASNLDEFYMVRVASLKDMVHAKYMKQDIAGMTAQEQLDAIRPISWWSCSIPPISVPWCRLCARTACGSSWSMRILQRRKRPVRTPISRPMYTRCLPPWPLIPHGPSR